MTATARFEQRRRPTIFDEVPWLYDRFRPGYPDDVIEAVIELARMSPGSAVLEVGAGTGQLTLPIVGRGFRVTGLEPGRRMAALLARKLRNDTSSTVIAARFEDAPIAWGTHDLVISATAFHWVDPSRRYALAADALRPGGGLALLRNDHVAAPSSAPFYRGVRELYARHAPELGAYGAPSTDELRGFADEVEASGRFSVLGERRFEWEERYSAASIVGLLRTYSDHRALPARRRARLHAAIRGFVETELDGSFVDRYVTTLCIGQRVDG